MKVLVYWESLCKSKRLKGTSYDVLISHYKDKLIVAKLEFSRDVARHLKLYLLPFPADSLMVPYLSEIFGTMFCQIMIVFCKIARKMSAEIYDS